MIPIRDRRLPLAAMTASLALLAPAATLACACGCGVFDVGDATLIAGGAGAALDGHIQKQTATIAGGQC